MNQSEIKADVASSIGSMLTKVEDGKLTRSAEWGRFFCSVENFDNFNIIQRNFETAADPVNIPFSCDEPGVQMIFSLDGQSVFNKKSHPFILSPVSHSLNYFKQYECTNLLGPNARQHDIAFRLKKGFYADLIENQLTSSADRLPAMIYHQKEFNTINQHIPADAAILGLLKNIMECPFKGNMRSAFIGEHIRALFILQLFHFNPVVSGKELVPDQRISKRDEEILQEAKRYIDQHFLEPASLDSLSKRFGINEFKLKHGFKALFETSPIRYLQYKRLEYSLMLLRDTDKTIKKIADEVGYSHAANYTSAFTKAFGHPPQHYRSNGARFYNVEDAIAEEVAA